VLSVGEEPLDLVEFRYVMALAPLHVLLVFTLRHHSARRLVGRWRVTLNLVSSE